MRLLRPGLHRSWGCRCQSTVPAMTVAVCPHLQARASALLLCATCRVAPCWDNGKGLSRTSHDSAALVPHTWYTHARTQAGSKVTDTELCSLQYLQHRIRPQQLHSAQAELGSR